MTMCKWLAAFPNALSGALAMLPTMLRSSSDHLLRLFLFGKPRSTEMLPIVSLKCLKNPLISSLSTSKKLWSCSNKSSTMSAPPNPAKTTQLLPFAGLSTQSTHPCLIKYLSIASSLCFPSKAMKKNNLQLSRQSSSLLPRILKSLLPTKNQSKKS